MAQPGMFGDGLLHATIARNMAIGAGSLWAPRYTETAWFEYYEHPPLGLALEAMAFRALGDHLVVERLYSLLVLALHAAVIAGIWRRLFSARLDWLAVLFWLTPSIVSWGAVNNMLENTQALLTTTAVLLMLDATRASTAAATIVGSAAAGIAVVAAALTKGPAGFFPLVAPLVFAWLIPSTAGAADRRRRLLAILTPAVVVLAAGALLAAYEPSRHNLTMYVRTQLAPSLLGQRGVSEPWGIFQHLLAGIVARMAALLALSWWLGRPARVSPVTDSTDRAAAGAFLLLGACAAGPFAFSARFSGHYLLPAVPMFALGFASLAAVFFVGARVRKALIVVPLLAAVVLVTIHGRRDEALIRDLAAIEPAMPRAAVIGACPNPRASRDWGLHTYVQRWFRVSLDARAQPVNGWFLRADAACSVPDSCVPAAAGQSLTLFRCGR